MPVATLPAPAPASSSGGFGLNYFLTHHGETASLSQRGLWSAPVISSELRQFLDPFVVRLAPESERGCLGYGSLPPDEMSLV